MRNRLLSGLLCLSIMISAAPTSLQGQGFAIGYQYALFDEYISGYVMLFDMVGPLGVYANFYGIGVKNYADYDTPWPGDELMFTTDRSYWAAQSIGATFTIFPGLFVYAGYCNGHYIDVHESQWFDETYIFSSDGFYSTQEWTHQYKPGFDIGINIFPITYFGMVLGYNSSLNSVVVGINTSIYF